MKEGRLTDEERQALLKWRVRERGNPSQPGDSAGGGEPAELSEVRELLYPLASKRRKKVQVKQQREVQEKPPASEGNPSERNETNCETSPSQEQQHDTDDAFPCASHHRGDQAGSEGGDAGGTSQGRNRGSHNRRRGTHIRHLLMKIKMSEEDEALQQIHRDYERRKKLGEKQFARLHSSRSPGSTSNHDSVSRQHSSNANDFTQQHQQEAQRSAGKVYAHSVVARHVSVFHLETYTTPVPEFAKPGPITLPKLSRNERLLYEPKLSLPKKKGSSIIEGKGSRLAITEAPHASHHGNSALTPAPQSHPEGRSKGSSLVAKSTAQSPLPLSPPLSPRRNEKGFLFSPAAEERPRLIPKLPELRIPGEADDRHGMGSSKPIWDRTHFGNPLSYWDRVLMRQKLVVEAQSKGGSPIVAPTRAVAGTRSHTSLH